MKRQIYASVVIVIFTGITLGWVFKQQPASIQNTPAQDIPVVEMITARSETLTIPLQARGIIEPEKQITLVAQVIGTVTHISKAFETGASFNKGDILLQADTTYLNLELQKAKAAYNQAAFHELEVKAQIEAGSFIDDSSKTSTLAQGIPQLEVATSAKDAALAALQAAKKQMDNATLRAPFNGRVMTRNIQEQEQLVIGRPLAQIYSTDSYRIRFPLTQAQLELADIPAANNTSGNPGIIISNESTQQQWRGKILHSEGYIAANRMVYIIAEVFSDKSTLAEIIPGSLLRIDMMSKPLHNAIMLPSKALQGDGTVWTITADNRLHNKTVQVLHRSTEAVYITGGLNSSDRVVVNQIAGMTENLPVKALDAGLKKNDAVKDIRP